MIADKVIANPTPSIIPLKERLNNRLSPEIDAIENPRIGDMRGATSIAPMITAEESMMSPRVAIVQDRTIRTKKSVFGEDESIRSFSTIALRVCVSLCRAGNQPDKRFINLIIGFLINVLDKEYEIHISL